MNGSGLHLPSGLEPRSEPKAGREAGPTGTDEASVATVIVGATGPGKVESAGDPNPYLPGEVIGDRYRLVRELGQGGMGVVWVAHALSLEVDVAVKLIRVSVAGQSVAARMAREAHAAARLGHPALVRVFDFGWTNRADPFLVMELVQGDTLSALLAREPTIAAIRSVQMILPIADGLRLAHQHSIVHRDIKPENILISRDALGRVQPKLLDFGIAKVGLSNTDLRLTQAGVALGSPEYMSPEQAQGLEDIDERTDVWSLAVVLYEMTTGNIPFEQENYNALLQSIIHDAPAPIPTDTALDPALWQVIERGLRKDRDQRWRSMAEFGEALALWLYEHGTKEDISGNSIRAVWLDGAVSGIRHDPVTASSEPALSLASRLSTPPGWSSSPTTEAVAQQRRDLVRVGATRLRRSTVALALVLAGILIGVIRTRTSIPDGLSVALPMTHVGTQLVHSVAAAVAARVRTVRLSARDLNSYAQDPRDLPLAGDTRLRATVSRRSMEPSQSTKKSSARRRPRDFGF